MQTSLNISQNGIFSLSIIKKWSFFLSICGFVFSGLMIVFGIFLALLGDKLSKLETETPVPSFLFLIFYAILGVIYYFPAFYLYKFSVTTNAAIESGAESSVEDSLKYLRSFFTFTGVLAIIMIVFFFLAFFAGIMAAVFMSAPTNTINS